jgi:hypothetical protein
MTMGKLRDALRAKYPNARAAIIALGLDPELLNPKHLATDSKTRKLVVDSAASFQREIGNPEPEMADGMADLGDEEAEQSLDAEETEADPDEREFRKWRMKELGRRLMDEKGFTLDQVRDLLRHPDFPQNALGESRSEQITEDAEVVLKDLVGMGGGPLTEARDRRKMAKDAAHRRRFNRMFPDAQRLEPRPGDFANYGDQPEPTLAMDEQSDGADGRFAEWYPMLANLRVE